MMLPHEPPFPHRRRIVIAAVALGASAALVWPGLDLGRRIAAPCAVVLALASAAGAYVAIDSDRNEAQQAVQPDRREITAPD